MFRRAIIAGFVASLVLLPALAGAKSDGDHGRANDQGQNGQSNNKDNGQKNNNDHGTGGGDHGGGMPGGIGHGGGKGGGGQTAQASEPITWLAAGAGFIGAVMLRRRRK